MNSVRICLWWRKSNRKRSSGAFISMLGFCLCPLFSQRLTVPYIINHIFTHTFRQQEDKQTLKSRAASFWTHAQGILINSPSMCSCRAKNSSQHFFLWVPLIFSSLVTVLLQNPLKSRPWNISGTHSRERIRCTYRVQTNFCTKYEISRRQYICGL